MFQSQRSMVWRVQRACGVFDLNQSASAGYVRQILCAIYCVTTAECVTCPAVADYSHCVIDKRSCGTLTAMSLLLWGCAGHDQARLQALPADFVRWFRDNVTAFPLVQERLTTYLLSSDADIIHTGSPQPLVKRFIWITIAARVHRQPNHRGYGGWVLTMRCLGHEKVAQLERKSAHRCGCTVAIATVIRTIRCFIHQLASNPAVDFSNWNRVKHSVRCIMHHAFNRSFLLSEVNLATNTG